MMLGTGEFASRQKGHESYSRGLVVSRLSASRGLVDAFSKQLTPSLG